MFSRCKREFVRALLLIGLAVTPPLSGSGVAQPAAQTGFAAAPTPDKGAQTIYGTVRIESEKAVSPGRIAAAKISERCKEIAARGSEAQILAARTDSSDFYVGLDGNVWCAKNSGSCVSVNCPVSLDRRNAARKQVRGAAPARTGSDVLPTSNRGGAATNTGNFSAQGSSSYQRSGSFAGGGGRFGAVSLREVEADAGNSGPRSPTCGFTA